MPMPTTEQREIERAELWSKKRKALEMRLDKMSYRAIASELGVAVPTVSQWVRELTAIELPAEEMEDLRAHEAAGLDESELRIKTMMSIVAERASKRQQDGQAVGFEVEQLNSLEKTLAEVRKQRALLLGINKPVMVKHNVTIRNVLDDEIEALVSELSGGGNIMSDPERVDIESDGVDA